MASEFYEGRKASCFVSQTVITVPIKFPFIEVCSLQSSGYFHTKAASFSTHFFHVSVKHYAGHVKLFAETSRSSSRTPCISSLWAAKRLEFIFQAPKRGKSEGGKSGLWGGEGEQIGRGDFGG
jgi:hypothetical protein